MMSDDVDDRQPVRLLWTGGWDSSFRLMQLLLVQCRVVRPVYVLNPERRSTMQELESMHRMLGELRSRLGNRGALGALEVHLRSDYSPTAELQALYQGILARGIWIGSQYVYLAAVAEALGWTGVEICMQAHDDGPTPLHRLVFTDTAGTLSDTPEAQLFRYFSFPVLNTTKPEMAAIAREHGFMDLLSQRWFCHDPLHGKACGRCRPCQLANRDGVDFANPVVAIGREVARYPRGLVRKAVRRGLRASSHP